MFILSIGYQKFAIPSAAIAAAIRDALQDREVRCANPSQLPENTYWLPSAIPVRIAIASADPHNVILPEKLIPANVTAVLGEPPASRARTHKILSMAAADHSRAVADHYNPQN